MNQLLLLIGILIIPIYIIWGIRDYRLIKKNRSYLITSYQYTIAFNVFLIVVLSLISEHTNFYTDFSKIGKGAEVFETDMISGMITAIVVVLLVLPIIIEKRKVEMPQAGDFAALLPKTNQELVWFFFVVISVAIGEELIFREFYFELLNQNFGLTGDALLIVTAVIFGIVHSYQGLIGVVATFILGLALGKIFQTTESLLVPIILHFLIDIKFVWNVLVRRYYQKQ